MSILHLRIQNFQSDRELKLVWSQGGEWPIESRSTCKKWNLILIFPALTKMNEWNSVQAQSNRNFSGSPSCYWESLHDNVLWTDIISSPAQVDIYFCFMIPSCAALQLTLIKCIWTKCPVGIKFGNRRWLNGVVDVQKEGERGDRKTATKMVRMMFFSYDVKGPLFYPRATYKTWISCFWQLLRTWYSVCFACLSMLMYFLQPV